MNFPLYDSLISGIPAKTVKDLKPTEKKFFVDNVAALNQEGKELIYALIVVFHIKNETVVDDSINLPYKGKFVETGVLEFNFNLFPAKLKRILHKFMVLHLAATENAVRDRSSNSR
jgi:hypothetical protein